MEDWISPLLLKWKSEGIKLNPPASIMEIESTEAILNFKFPQDFKDFYLQVNGFADWDMQEHSFSFWPLERIVEEFNEDDCVSFIGFSDWAIRCNDVGFIRNKPGIYKYDNNFEPISQSFAEVVELINNGDGRIY